MNYIIYPTYGDLLNKHNEVIRKSGGIMGVFNENLLRGFIEFIQKMSIIRVSKKSFPIWSFLLLKIMGFAMGIKERLL